MRPAISIQNIFILLCLIIFISSCAINEFIPAQKRTFSSIELTLTKEELFSNWKINTGYPRKTKTTMFPPDTHEIQFSKQDSGSQEGIVEYASIFASEERAKRAFKEGASFPGNVNFPEWSFSSKVCDEQKFSCYYYSNKKIPVCTWLARYDEILIEVFAWIEPKFITIADLEMYVVKIDEKVSSKVKKVME